MWQAFLWAIAIGIAFCIWDSLSRANAELESRQRVAVNPKRTEKTRTTQ